MIELGALVRIVGDTEYQQGNQFCDTKKGCLCWNKTSNIIAILETDTIGLYLGKTRTRDTNPGFDAKILVKEKIYEVFSVNLEEITDDDKS